MNAFYLEQPALWEQDDSWQGFQWICADDNTADTVSFLRWDKSGKPLAIVCNFSPIHREGYRIGVPFAGTWSPVFNTDEQRFGGQGLGDHDPIKTEKVPYHDQQQSLVIDLPPMSAMIYRCTRRAPVRKPKADKAASASEAKAPVKEKKAVKAKAPKEEAPKTRTRTTRAKAAKAEPVKAEAKPAPKADVKPVQEETPKADTKPTAAEAPKAEAKPAKEAKAPKAKRSVKAAAKKAARRKSTP